MDIRSNHSQDQKRFSEDTIVEESIQELDLMFQGNASKSFTGEYFFEDWSANPFVLGTWTHAFEENPRDLQILNESLQQKVYFAGEIYDPYRQMGVPGAILSGYYAIDQLLMRK